VCKHAAQNGTFFRVSPREHLSGNDLSHVHESHSRPQADSALFHKGRKTPANGALFEGDSIIRYKEGITVFRDE